MTVRRNIAVRNVSGNHYFHIALVYKRANGTVRVWGIPVRNTEGYRLGNSRS